MATAPNTFERPVKSTSRPDRGKDPLRRDRITDLLVLVGFAILMALIVWLGFIRAIPEFRLGDGWWMMP